MVGNENDVKPDIIAGRNPVSEAIRSSRPIDKILVARGEKAALLSESLLRQGIKKYRLKKLTAQNLTTSAAERLIRA